jgi:cell division protein FtsQ
MLGRTAPPQVSPDEDTVRLVRGRFARRQWTRRWLAWRRLLLVVLAVALAAGLVWLFYFSSVLAVAGATVSGAPGADALQVRRAAQVPVGTPLAAADLGAVTARVERLPIVKSADVSRSWPDRVRIDVTERTPVALVARGGAYSAVDEHGVLFRRYARRPAGLPVVRMGPRAQSDALAEAAQVASVLPEDIVAKVAHLNVRTVDSITLHLHNGREILWGSADSSADKARVLAVLLRQRAAFYDVSVPEQPVIRP